MMTEDQQKRLAGLRNPKCDFEFVRELYGLDLKRDEFLTRDFSFWLRQRSGASNGCMDEGKVNRHHLELFLQSRELFPKKWGALRVGMDEESLDRVLQRLEDEGQGVLYHRSSQVVGRKIDQDLAGLFNDLRFRTFCDHNDFCRELHKRIVSAFKVEVSPVVCKTSEKIGRKPLDYGHDFDAITLEPVCLRYQVWLDFGKPLRLPPDCCSKLLYLENQEVLRPFLAGKREPDLPEELISIHQEVTR